MKKIILISCVFLCTYSFSQEKINLEKASDNIQKIINYQLDNSEPNIFISDFKTIESIIKLTAKKYKIIYSFSDRCHSCVETFPTLVQFINKNSDKFELLPIIGHRNKEIPHFVEYLKKIKYFNPMYLLDMKKYGTKKNPFKRIDQLTQKLCKECDYKKMGFSSFYVFDNNNKIVAHNNWDFSWAEKLEQLKQLVSEE
jgi:thiol-disulfide isomerase/thioredoxin